jgi:dihydrofolate reductase
VSTKLDGVSWPPTAKIVRNLAELRTLKGQAGKNIYVVGGPTLAVSVLNEGLIDELKLIVHPILLGGGKALFAGVDGRRSLKLVEAEPSQSGKVILTYRT